MWCGIWRCSWANLVGVTRRRLTSCPYADKKTEQERNKTETMEWRIIRRHGEREKEDDRLDTYIKNWGKQKVPEKVEDEYNESGKQAERERELWLNVLAMALFCRREQLLLCVRRELYIWCIPHAALSQWYRSRKRVIPEGPEECLYHWFHSRMTSLENFFLFPILFPSLSPQLWMLKALHTHWKHTLHSPCAKHTHTGNNRAHTPLRFSILTISVVLFYFVPFCTNYQLNKILFRIIINL